MANAIIQAPTDDPIARYVNPIVGVLTGNQAHKGFLNVVQWNSASTPTVRVRNENSSGKALVAYAANGSTEILATTNTGVTMAGTLGVTGATSVSTLTASGAITANGGISTTTLTASGAITANGGISTTTLTASGAITANGGLTTTTLTATGNTVLGNENTDTVTVVGVSTFRNAAGSATQLHVDAGNNRVIVGSSTAMGSDTTPNLQVVGRLYVAPESANDFAMEIRREASSGTFYRLGVTSGGELSVKDLSDTAVAFFDDSGGTYQFRVSGDAQVSDDLAVGARLVVGGSSWSGSEELRVDGQSRLEGAVTITSGGLGVTGSSAFNNAVTIVDGGLNILTDGASITGDFSVVNSGTKIDVTDDGVGFNGQAGATPPNYTVSSYTTVARSINQGTSSTSEVREVLAQVIIDLIAVGIFQ